MALSDIQDRLLKVEPAARLAVEVALIVAIGGLVARMIWLALAPQPAVAAYSERPLPTMQTTQVGRIDADVSLLVRTNPFEGAGSVTEVVEDAPETQLNLKLIGLRAESGPNPGTATIVLPNNQQKKFSEGEEVLPGVELKSVLSDRVILNRNGIDEVLRLNNRSGRFSVLDSDGAPAETTSAPPEAVTIQISNPSAVLSAVSLSNARANGQIIGYRLDARGSVERLQGLGFQPGDVLLRINGGSVADKDPLELMSMIGGDRETQLDIVRDGDPIEVILEIDR